MILFLDPHTHIYPCYNLESCLNNFAKNSVQTVQKYLGILDEEINYGFVLTERQDCAYYDYLSSKVNIQDSNCSYAVTQGSDHLVIKLQDGFPIHVFKGIQINSLERIEVLGLLPNTSIPNTLEKMELPEMLEAMDKAGMLPVINWAPGKWWSARGNKIRSLLRSSDHKRTYGLGFSRLLPTGFSLPSLIQSNPTSSYIIAGSDPLPFSGEEKQFGRLGMLFRGPIEEISHNSITKKILAKEFSIIGTRSNLPTVIYRLFRNEITRFFAKSRT